MKAAIRKADIQSYI